MRKWMRMNMQNFCFLLLTFVTGVFYFCFYLVSLIFGLSMSFTIIGIPILTYVMRTTRTFMNFDRIQVKFYTDITIESVSRRETFGSSWTQARVELADPKNWKAVVVLMLKFIIGIISLFCAVLFFIAPLLWILVPMISPFVDVKISLIPVDSLSKSVLVMISGVALAYAGSWAGNGAVRLVGEYTRWMFTVWK
ncbi:MAG: sensor domain-containing protein [Bacillota bacterium]